MILLKHGLRKVSTDMEEYPIHKSLFDVSLKDLVDLSYHDKATLASLKLFGSESDPWGNCPLKVAVSIGDYQSVEVLLKSGCANPDYRPEVVYP